MALASRAEVMSLVVMEAMAQNANIVLTDHSEWKPPGVSYCEFGNQESIEKALRVELLRPKDINRWKYISQYKWEDVAKQIKQIYESICSNSGV